MGCCHGGRPEYNTYTNTHTLTHTHAHSIVFPGPLIHLRNVFTGRGGVWVCVCSVWVCVSFGYQPCIIQSERKSRKVKARPVYNTQEKLKGKTHYDVEGTVRT